MTTDAFRPASARTPAAVVAIAGQVRVRVLRWFARSGLIGRDKVREMLAWQNSGFLIDAAVPASPRTIAPAWSGCCATTHARRSRLSAWSCPTPSA